MKEELLKQLDDWNIGYELKEHKAVYTVEEAQTIEDQLAGTGCKNLFLTDKKGSYYLYVLEEIKRANLKEIGQQINKKNLTFASEEDLKKLLNLRKGSVTPLGIINDLENKVNIILDRGLVNKTLLVHPNRNTATLSMKYTDLLRFIKNTNHQYIII